MSTRPSPRSAALDIPEHRQLCARMLGEYIRMARKGDGRPLEELAPSAGLTVEEWTEIEEGRLQPAWEAVLMLATVLRLGRSWMPYLRRLYVKAWWD
jgi:DNA-binding XRE family transcriptional regulator